MTWIVLGESAIGTSHRTRGTVCQDAYRVRTCGEWLTIVAADGAGSASHAHIGAALACDEFIRRVEAVDPISLFTRDKMTALFAGVRGELLAEADRLGVRPRELACTALVAVVGPDSAAFAQVGDGAIVVGDGGTYRAAFWPEPAEYANTTDFLTDDRFADVLLFDAGPNLCSQVAALTDGLQRLALDYAARAPHPEFFRPLFQEVMAAADLGLLAEPFLAFLDSARINARTDDDKTLVLAVRRP